MCLKPNDRCTWVYFQASTQYAAADFFHSVWATGLVCLLFQLKIFLQLQMISACRESFVTRAAIRSFWGKRALAHAYRASGTMNAPSNSPE